VGLGLPSHPVLRFPVGEAFGGLRTLHVDDDGVLDAVVWTEAAVYALRGRPGGGMTWGVGLRGDGYSVGSATMGDVSGDGLADLVVAWAGSRGDRLQILEGNGRWRFDETTPQHLRAAPMDVVVGDNIDEGLAQITVLLDDGDWARLARGERDYLGAGPDLKLDFEVGTTMESAPDINGDGGDELLFFAPYVEGAQREVRLYDLVGRLQFLPITVLGGRFSLADSDRDGLTELWMLDAEHKLVHLRWGESQYRQRKVGQVTEHGLLAAGDVDGDRVADAFVAGELGRWWLGTNDLGEDAELWWGVDSPSTGRWAVGALGPVARAELDEDPTTFELVALRDDGGIVLQAWAAVAGAPAQIQDEGAVAVEVGEAPDLAACGEVAWVATGTELVRVDLVPSPEVAGQVEIAATRVDCGVGPQGAEVAVLVGDEVVLYDGDLVELGREDAPEARDLALVDLGGGASVETCAGEGCRAVAWTWGALGEQAVAVSTAEGIEVTTAAGAAFLPGRGELSTGDADGDGHDDLLVATADGAIGVFRSTGQGFGPGSFGHLERVLIGPALVADATGDGLPDAWIVEDDGDLAHTTAP